MGRKGNDSGFAVVPLFLFSVYYFSRNCEMQAHLGSAIKAN